MTAAKALAELIERSVAAALQEERLEQLRRMPLRELRMLWDSFDDETSFCGDYDCADVHAVLTERGDGEYCAV